MMATVVDRYEGAMKVRLMVGRIFPGVKRQQPVCLQVRNGWGCTRRPHKTGPHVAHGGWVGSVSEALAMWFDDDEGVVTL